MNTFERYKHEALGHNPNLITIEKFVIGINDQTRTLQKAWRKFIYEELFLDINFDQDRNPGYESVVLNVSSIWGDETHKTVAVIGFENDRGVIINSPYLDTPNKGSKFCGDYNITNALLYILANYRKNKPPRVVDKIGPGVFNPRGIAK